MISGIEPSKELITPQCDIVSNKRVVEGIKESTSTDLNPDQESSNLKPSKQPNGILVGNQKEWHPYKGRAFDSLA